jgi:hypothetical protein
LSGSHIVPIRLCSSACTAGRPVEHTSALSHAVSVILQHGDFIGGACAVFSVSLRLCGLIDTGIAA